MKKLWIQYIILILCAGTLFAVFPAFSDRIPLAEAEVDWQNSGYVNQFGDLLIPIPSSSRPASSSSPDSSFSLSSQLLSSAGGLLSSLPSSQAASIATDPTVSVVPIPSSRPVSSRPASSAAASSTASAAASSKLSQSSSASSSAAASSSSSSSSSSASPESEETVYIMEGGKAVQYNISDILPRIVEAEIGGSSPVEAIKAQAVATHTFIRYYNDIESSAPSVAQKTPTTATINACKEVMDKLLTVGGQPIYSPYCAATAGRTNASEEVWGGTLSYLRSVESIYDNEDTKNWNTQTTISVSTVRQKLEASFGITMTGEPETWLKVLDYTQGGYNKNMTVCGKSTTGRYLRESVLKLKSACFTWKVEGSNFIFTTKGYGHGVGLSQMGAVGYARHGYTYDRILTHYYTGVTITTV